MRMFGLKRKKMRLIFIVFILTEIFFFTVFVSKKKIEGVGEVN